MLSSNKLLFRVDGFERSRQVTRKPSRPWVPGVKGVPRGQLRGRHPLRVTLLWLQGFPSALGFW